MPTGPEYASGERPGVTRVTPRSRDAEAAAADGRRAGACPADRCWRRCRGGSALEAGKRRKLAAGPPAGESGSAVDHGARGSLDAWTLAARSALSLWGRVRHRLVSWPQCRTADRPSGDRAAAIAARPGELRGQIAAGSLCCEVCVAKAVPSTPQACGDGCLRPTSNRGCRWQ